MQLSHTVFINHLVVQLSHTVSIIHLVWCALFEIILRFSCALTLLNSINSKLKNLAWTSMEYSNNRFFFPHNWIVQNQSLPRLTGWLSWQVRCYILSGSRYTFMGYRNPMFTIPLADTHALLTRQMLHSEKFECMRIQIHALPKISNSTMPRYTVYVPALWVVPQFYPRSGAH